MPLIKALRTSTGIRPTPKPVSLGLYRKVLKTLVYRVQLDGHAPEREEETRD